MASNERWQPDADVIVVGAAVAGTAVANALGAAGVRALVLEKGAERDNSTRGDILHPPTLAFLDRWGVLEALHRDGALPITNLSVSHRDLGRLATYPVTPVGEGPASRSIALPHDRIESVMRDCAERWPSVTIWRATVTGLLRDGNGRVVGVRAQTPEGERDFRAAVVVGCDGAPSLVRRQLGIEVDAQPYWHDLLYISADGQTEPPATMHFNLDPEGVIMVVSRPRERMRIALSVPRGGGGRLLRQPDPYLHDYVARRVPWLASARFGRHNAYVYALSRHLARQFYAPGAALVGDAAHNTHPAGATGMNLAITGTARLADLLVPPLLAGAVPAAIDAALAAYDAERRPAAAAAVERNHQQARRIWGEGVQHDPAAYARAIDPNGPWGVGGAGWGKNPAALRAEA